MTYAESTLGEGGMTHRWIHSYSCLPQTDTTFHQEARSDNTRYSKIAPTNECMVISNEYSEPHNRRQWDGVHDATATVEPPLTNAAMGTSNREQPHRKIWTTVEDMTRIIGTKGDLDRFIQDLRSEALRTPYIPCTRIPVGDMPKMLIRDNVDIGSYEVANLKALFLTSKELRAAKGQVNQMRYRKTMAALSIENDAILETVRNRLMRPSEEVRPAVKALLFMFFHDVERVPEPSKSLEWRVLTRLLLFARRWQLLQNEFGVGFLGLLSRIQVPNSYVELLTNSDLERWIAMIKTLHPHVHDLAASVEPIVLECVEEQPPAAVQPLEEDREEGDALDWYDMAYSWEADAPMGETECNVNDWFSAQIAYFANSDDITLMTEMAPSPLGQP